MLAVASGSPYTHAVQLVAWHSIADGPARRMTRVHHSRLSTPAVALGSVGVYALAFVVRLAFAEFNNDDYIYLTQGYQIVHGHVPHRDFGHPGALGQIYSSAALQWIFGHRLLGEMLYSSAMISLAAALTTWFGTRLSGSLAVGLMLGGISLLAFPRIYNYPKHIVLAAALAALWVYAAKPGRWSAAVLGATIAGAFYFRHDFVVYVGAGALTLILLRHPPRDWLPRLALPLGISVLLIAPLGLFFQFNGGIGSYARQALSFVWGTRQFESSASPLPSFRLDTSKPLLAITPAPPLAWPVTVRWPAELGAQERMDLEQRLGLGNAQPRGESWTYSLDGDREDQVRALLAVPGVSVGGVDPLTARPTEPPREGVFAGVQRRVPLLRLQVLPGVLAPTNGLPFLFFLSLALPAMGLVAFLWALRKGGKSRAPGGLLAFVGSSLVLCALALAGLLRPPLEDRLADVVIPCAFVAAWLLGLMLRPGDHPEGAARSGVDWPMQFERGARGLLVGLLLVVTALSMLTISPLQTVLSPGAMSSVLQAGPRGLWEVLNQRAHMLGTSPPLAAWAPPGATGLPALTRYVSECTDRSDQLLAMWFAPEVYFHADREFAAGRLFFLPGIWASLDDQVDTLLRLLQRPPPFVVADLDAYENMSNSFYLLDDYLFGAYRIATESRFGDGKVWYRVWVPRDRTPTSTYGPDELPCFRGAVSSAGTSL